MAPARHSSAEKYFRTSSTALAAVESSLEEAMPINKFGSPYLPTSPLLLVQDGTAEQSSIQHGTAPVAYSVLTKKLPDVPKPAHVAGTRPGSSPNYQTFSTPQGDEIGVVNAGNHVHGLQSDVEEIPRPDLEHPALYGRRDKAHFIGGVNQPPEFVITELHGTSGSDRIDTEVFKHMMPESAVMSLVKDIDALAVVLPRDDHQFKQILKAGYTVQWTVDGQPQSFTISLNSLRDNLDTIRRQVRNSDDQMTPELRKRSNNLLGKIERGLNSLGLEEDFRAPPGGRASVNAALLASYVLSAAIPLYVSSQEERYAPIMFAAYTKSALQLLRLEFDKSSHWGSVTMNWRQRHMVNILATILFVIPHLRKDLGPLAQHPALVGISNAMTLVGFLIRADPTAIPKMWRGLVETARKSEWLQKAHIVKKPDDSHVPDDVLDSAVQGKLGRYALGHMRNRFNSPEYGGKLSPPQNSTLSKIMEDYGDLFAGFSKAVTKETSASQTRPQSTIELNLKEKIANNLKENIYFRDKLAVTIVGVIILASATAIQAIKSPSADPETGELANPAGFSDMLADLLGVTGGNLWMTMQASYNREDLADAFRNFIGLSLLSIPFLLPNTLDASKDYLSNPSKAVPALIGFAISNLLIPGVLGVLGTRAVLAALSAIFPDKAADKGKGAATAGENPPVPDTHGGIMTTDDLTDSNRIVDVTDVEAPPPVATKKSATNIKTAEPSPLKPISLLLPDDEMDGETVATDTVSIDRPTRQGKQSEVPYQPLPQATVGLGKNRATALQETAQTAEPVIRTAVQELPHVETDTVQRTPQTSVTGVTGSVVNTATVDHAQPSAAQRAVTERVEVLLGEKKYGEALELYREEIAAAAGNGGAHAYFSGQAERIEFAFYEEIRGVLQQLMAESVAQRGKAPDSARPSSVEYRSLNETVDFWLAQGGEQDFAPSKHALCSAALNWTTRRVNELSEEIKNHQKKNRQFLDTPDGMELNEHLQNLKNGQKRFGSSLAGFTGIAI